MEEGRPRWNLTVPCGGRETSLRVAISTHRSTPGKLGWHIVLPTDLPPLVCLADLLKLRSLAYSTQAFGTGTAVVRYLARTVKRCASGDERIIEAGDEAVRFRYTESGTGQRKELTLSAVEFMRRYLQHVPPPGQHRVRYFGWLHPSAWRRRLKVETLLATVIVVRPAAPPVDWSRCCPHCRQFTLVCVGRLPRGPPP